MAKFRPGIPDNFSLDVEPVRDLGDYLDEPSPVMPRKGREEAVPEPAAAPAPETAVASAAVGPTPPPKPAPEVDDMREGRGGWTKGPRREVSMSPETLRMTDELLEIIRSGSGQRDTYASELIHALVLLAYEAKGGLDAHSIPRRGRWGSPTARAYPLELKNAFLKALLERLVAAPEGVIRLSNSLSDAA